MLYPHNCEDMVNLRFIPYTERLNWYAVEIFSKGRIYADYTNIAFFHLLDMQRPSSKLPGTEN